VKGFNPACASSTRLACAPQTWCHFTHVEGPLHRATHYSTSDLGGSRTRTCRVKTCRNAKKGKASDLAGHVRTPMQE